MPTLSIVTITYNDEAGLTLTASSLGPLFRAWPASAWEHVVVDGSPPLTRKCLDALPEGWPLVHVEQAPGGISEAFNQGIAAARGEYVYFLNSGDGLRDQAALSRMLATLVADPAADFVCGGAYLHRRGQTLYPVVPRRSLAANLVGRSWIYHQAVVYRRASLRAIGGYATAYRLAGDYDLHLRCYVAGQRGRFTDDVVVDYDMGGDSSDVVAVFAEFKRVQREHAADLPPWLRWANELVRPLEYGRIRAQRQLADTRLGAVLRPAWAGLNRWIRGLSSWR